MLIWKLAGCRHLAAGLVLLLPAIAHGQTVTTTVPVGTNPVAIAVNPITNKTYVANCPDLQSRTTGIDGTVTVIDGDTNSTATIQAGLCPTAVAVNPVTNKIYVANFGHMSLYCGSCWDYGNITVIDGVTNSTATIKDSNAKFPHAVAVNPVTNKIYVANNFNNSSGNVTVIDGETNSTATVAVGPWPYDVAVNSTTNKVYVTSYNPYAGATSTTVSVIDGATNISTPLTDPKAADPIAVAVNPVTNKIYVANIGNVGKNGTNIGSITVIDGATNSTTNLTDPNAFSPHAVTVNPVSNRIYVANANSTAGNNNGGVTAIDGATNSVSTIADPNAGTACDPFSTANVAVDPTRNLVYVANCGSNNVTVIDAATNSVLTVTDSNAAGPIAVGVNSVTNKIYVANAGSNNVTVIDGGVGTESFTLSVTEAVRGSVTSNPAGIDCGSTCVASFVAGTHVSLSAVSNSGSTFSGWSGACEGVGSCTITINANESVTATFTSTQDFTINLGATALTLKRGGQAQESLSFASEGGFSGTIALACVVSGPSSMPTCRISPNSVSPDNSATLTVNAAALVASLAPPRFERAGVFSGAWLPLGLVGCVLAAGLDKKRRRTWLLCLLVMVTTILPAACGSGGSSTSGIGPPPQNYTVTVTASSGALQHSTNINVTVN